MALLPQYSNVHMAHCGAECFSPFPVPACIAIWSCMKSCAVSLHDSNLLVCMSPGVEQYVLQAK
jgi:hypothetical protein